MPACAPTAFGRERVRKPRGYIGKRIVRGGKIDMQERWEPRYFRSSVCLVVRRRRRGRSAVQLVPFSALLEWNFGQCSSPAKPGRDRSLRAETQATMAAKVAASPLSKRGRGKGKVAFEWNCGHRRHLPAPDASARQQQEHKGPMPAQAASHPKVEQIRDCSTSSGCVWRGDR